MLIQIVKWLGAKALNRWILGVAVTLLLGGGALKWHNFKEDLIHKGQQVCVQEINKQTVVDLQNALADEKVVNATLVALAIADAKISEAARARLRVANESLETLALEIQEQKKNDKEYAAWSDVPLPDGVAERLRRLHSGSNTNPSNEDSN